MGLAIRRGRGHRGGARETGLSEARPDSFGDLTPLLAPRSVAVIGASDREGNLGGLAVGFLQKFGYAGRSGR